MYFIVHLVRQKNGRTLDPITFIPAQATPFPIDGDKEVDMTVTIGPKAKKPMEIQIPLMILGKTNKKSSEW